MKRCKLSRCMACQRQVARSYCITWGSNTEGGGLFSREALPECTFYGAWHLLGLK